MMKDLTDAQLAGMTPTQAGQEFGRAVIDYAAENQMESVSAWARMKVLLPRLFARAFPGAHARENPAPAGAAVTAGGPAVGTGMFDFSDEQLAGMTSSQAGQAFGQAVIDYAAENKLDSVPAWARVRGMMPKLYARAFPKAPAAVLPADDAQPQAIPPVLQPPRLSVAPPLGWKLMLPAMQLPPDTSPDEMAVAWYANNYRQLPLEAKGIISALTGFTVARKNVSLQEAGELVKQRFSALQQRAMDDASEVQS